MWLYILYCKSLPSCFSHMAIFLLYFSGADTKLLSCFFICISVLCIERMILTINGYIFGLKVHR